MSAIQTPCIPRWAVLIEWEVCEGWAWHAGLGMAAKQCAGVRDGIDVYIGELRSRRYGVK